MKEILTVFITMFLSEIADKTQFALISFASKSKNLFKIWLAATLAFCATNLIAVVLGCQLNKFLPPSIIKYLSGIVFIIIGIYTILSK
jgi:putative Ca2+/H+ antiporter (TMEM165/GDT1 family)